MYVCKYIYIYIHMYIYAQKKCEGYQHALHRLCEQTHTHVPTRTHTPTYDIICPHNIYIINSHRRRRAPLSSHTCSAVNSRPFLAVCTSPLYFSPLPPHLLSFPATCALLLYPLIFLCLRGMVCVVGYDCYCDDLHHMVGLDSMSCGVPQDVTCHGIHLE